MGEGGGYQAGPSENLDEGQNPAHRANGSGLYREVHESRVVELLAHEGMRFVEGRSFGWVDGVCSLGG